MQSPAPGRGRAGSVTAESVLTGLVCFCSRKHTVVLLRTEAECHCRLGTNGAWSASALAVSGTGEQLGLPQRRRHRFRSYKACSRCVPSTGRTTVEPGCVVKNDPREPLFRGRESKLRSGQRFLVKASKIKRLLTRIPKAERVTIRPTVKWLLFASAPRT